MTKARIGLLGFFLIALVGFFVLDTSNSRTYYEEAMATEVPPTKEVLPTTPPIPTLQPMEFSDLEGVAVSVKAEFLDYVAARIVFGDVSSLSFKVNTAAVSIKDVEALIPEGVFGPPCISGELFYKTGYPFTAKHPGIDGACKNYQIAASANAYIFREYENLPGSGDFDGDGQADSVTFWSSGHTLILVTKNQGSLVCSIYGHLKLRTEGDGMPKVGEVVSAGQILATMGNTGIVYPPTSGFHLHFGMIKDCGSTNATWLDPTSTALGRRP